MKPKDPTDYRQRQTPSNTAITERENHKPSPESAARRRNPTVLNGCRKPMPLIGGTIAHVDCKGGKAWLDRCVGRPIQVYGHYHSLSLIPL